MTRKRSAARPATRRPAAAISGPAAKDERPAPNPDAPISGVASGNLGTAANLDDTQVMRTADLQRAAAELAVPAWLTDDVPPLPQQPARWADEAVVKPATDPRNVPLREHVQPRERVQARVAAKAPPRPRGGINVSRRTSALAGAAAGAVLVLLAGAALLSNPGTLTTNSGVGQGPPFSESTLEPFATPTAEPTNAGKDCHGKGKGNGCKD